MIIVCEPICKKMSHEKVNSGFLYGLSLAFPGEKIRLYADITHIEAIKKILAHDKIAISQIEYKSLYIREHAPIIEAAFYYFVLFRMFNDVLKAKADKVFFLSFSPAMLYAIKRLKSKSRFATLKFAFVLHALLEHIANDSASIQGIALPRKEIPIQVPKSPLERLKRIDPMEIPGKIWRRLARAVSGIGLSSLASSRDFFPVKDIMEWKNSADYRYISLSPHVTKNAGKYVDIEKLNFHTVLLPTFFVAESAAPQNTHVKFAIFGYGNSLVLHNIAYSLSLKKISKPYEIRIIGMDNRGAEGFAHVTCMSNGQRLERDDMEKYAEDIDVFLILYDKTKYRLSCSAAIFEALSYSKPIIHFDNDCINRFNQDASPIGIRCYNFDEYVDKMADIIENYDIYKPILQGYRENIAKKREECSIENSVPDLRESFTW